MKRIIPRLACFFMCITLIVSSVISLPLREPREPHETENGSRGSVINGDNNKFINSDEVGKVSEKLIVSQTEAENETIAVEIDPFMEETFLLQADQNENIESVRKVADGGGKAIYAVVVANNAEDPKTIPDHETIPTDDPESAENDTKTDDLVETVKEQISNMTGVNEVKDAGSIEIPVSDLEKTYSGTQIDADGNLLVPFDVIHPEILDDENVQFESEHILIKMPKEFSGSLTNELTLCGISSLNKFMETDTGDWYRAKLVPGADTVTAVKKVRSLTAVIASDFDYIYETTLDGNGGEGGDEGGDGEEPAGSPDPMTDNPLASQQWYLNSCGIPEAWQFLEEHGISAGGSPDVIVAVIDTGVDYDHPDLKTSMWVNLGEIPGNGIDDDGNGFIDDIHGCSTIGNSFDHNGDPMDDNGHGTHVAGIIGAANNKEGILGVAYNTKIMAVKAGQASGVFNQSDIAEAILYAAANGADVINMSFGGPTTSLAVQDALISAYTKSVLVAAAGNKAVVNEGSNSMPFYPASNSYVIGVMSIGSNANESAFTNYDRIAFNPVEYEVYAPGERILSSFPSGRYISLNGTSMAAPVVSGIAALLRSYYSDLDMYPSRYIAAQIAATNNVLPLCRHTPAHNVPPIVNAYYALATFPKPAVHLYDFYITDNNDGYVDAGDTLDIGLILRNRWGMSKDTVVTLDTRTLFLDAETGEPVYGPENPYIEVINGTAALGGVGTYNTKSMMQYDSQGFITGIENPLIVKVSEDCPNDYTVKIRVLIEYKNGLDEEDERDYNSEGIIVFSVRKGIIKQGRITSDEVWTNDNYYIVPSSLFIEDNVTLTILEGTQVQLYSEGNVDIYNTSSIANIVVRGCLRTEGTEENPVVFMTCENKRAFNLQSVENGIITLNYTVVYNPNVIIDLADHCRFQTIYANTSLTAPDLYRISGTCIRNSLLDRVYRSYADSLSGVFDNCMIYALNTPPSRSREGSADSADMTASFVKCVLVSRNNIYSNEYNGYCVPRGGISGLESISFLLRNESSAYYKIKFNGNRVADFYTMYAVEELSRSFEGHLACFETASEMELVFSAVEDDILANEKIVVGLEYGSEQWINGESLGEWIEILPPDSTGRLITIIAANKLKPVLNFYDSCIIEVPMVGDTEETAEIMIRSFYDFIDSYNPTFLRNAVVSNYRQNCIYKLWTVKYANAFNNVISLAGNWWTTQDRNIINYSLKDFSYDALRASLNPEPWLDTPPEDVWPFVTDVYLLDHNGDRVYTVANEEVTFVVEFNRDMDADYGLRVRFGAAEPYAEYEVEGGFVTPRRWEGTYTLKTTIENGTQYFRIEDGRAADDHWMVLCEDPARFAFEIDTTAAMAMIMQGNATETGIELTWMQDDFDTLAGYNVYRSTREDGLYTKLNGVVIPVGSEYFFDSTVEPGVIYYYNFTVVLSDMSESTPSGKITIMSMDTMAPNVYHVPVHTAYIGSKLVISATVSDNLGIAGVKLYYRTIGAEEWLTATMDAINSKYYATISADKITLDGLEYYIEAFDGINYTYSGKDMPYQVVVKEAVDASSLGDVDGNGVITAKDALMIVQAINDLLNLTEDQFMRADINGDGELSSAEALRILKYVSGKVTTIV